MQALRVLSAMVPRPVLLCLVMEKRLSGGISREAGPRPLGGGGDSSTTTMGPGIGSGRPHYGGVPLLRGGLSARGIGERAGIALKEWPRVARRQPGADGLAPSVGTSDQGWGASTRPASTPPTPTPGVTTASAVSAQQSVMECVPPGRMDSMAWTSASTASLMNPKLDPAPRDQSRMTPEISPQGEGARRLPDR